jgi:hypothetical protein
MEILRNSGQSNSDSALTVLPSLKQDTSLEPRILTPLEINWLKENKKEAAKKLKGIFAKLYHKQVA